MNNFISINQEFKMKAYRTPISHPLLRLPFMVCLCAGAIAFLFLGSSVVTAQESQQMVRIAKIQVAPPHLDSYLKALREQMKAAVRLEKGVLSYHAVADKADSSRITILEVYADTAAYQSHIRTPHFLKYKDQVKDWVLALELVDVRTVGFYRKPEQ